MLLWYQYREVPNLKPDNWCGCLSHYPWWHHCSLVKIKTHGSLRHIKKILISVNKISSRVGKRHQVGKCHQHYWEKYIKPSYTKRWWSFLRRHEDNFPLMGICSIIITIHTPLSTANRVMSNHIRYLLHILSSVFFHNRIWGYRVTIMQ